MTKYLQPFKKYWIPSLLLLVLFVLLSFLYLYKWAEGANIQDSIWAVFEPVATLLTFVTTLVIFYLQAYSNWEKSLEKTLTISYFVTDVEEPKLILFIKDAYLSGESDIRQWAQSLGGQVFGRLQLDIAWDEHPVVIKKIGREYFKTFEVELYLPTNPLEIAEVSEKILPDFLKRKFSHSELTGDAKNLPIKWSRKR